MTNKIVDGGAIEEDLDFKEKDVVRCLICGKPFSLLTNSHMIKNHNITITEYRKMYPDARTQSDAIRNKKAASVKKSWEGADARREKNIKRFKQNNPMSNQASFDKMVATRRYQDAHHLKKTIKGCNFDGTPCRNPECSKKIHPDRTGENNYHVVAMRDNPKYKQQFSVMAKQNLGFSRGCVRDGKTVCPNCDVVHKDFTGENCPVNRPEVMKRIVDGMTGHTYDGTPCKKCGVVHTNKSEIMRAMRLTQDPTFASSIEKIVQGWLDIANIPYENNVRVRGLLQPTTEYKNLHFHPFDIVIKDMHTVIECNGCYWHGCPCRGTQSPISSEAMKKDEAIARQVRAAGWNYIVIWEHEIKEILGKSDGADVAGLSGLLNESMAPLASIISLSTSLENRSFAPAVSAPQYKWDERTDTFSRID